MKDTAANKTIIRKVFEEWVNKQNLAAIDEMVTPNYVSHERGQNTNADETKKFLAAVFTSFPDIHVEIQDMVGEGDKVMVRNIWTATHKGAFRGVAPSGNKVTFEGIVIWRIENGKVAERWAAIDYFSLMQQLASHPQ